MANRNIKFAIEEYDRLLRKIEHYSIALYSQCKDIEEYTEVLDKTKDDKFACGGIIDPKVIYLVGEAPNYAS